MLIGDRHAGIYRSHIEDYEYEEKTALKALDELDEFVGWEPKRNVYYALKDVDFTLYSLDKLIGDCDYDHITEPEKVFIAKILKAYAELNHDKLEYLADKESHD